MNHPLPEKKRRWFQERLLEWGSEHLRDFPWRNTDDPYRILVAEVLLQQTDAARVLPVYVNLIERYSNIGDLSNAPTSVLREMLQPIGFHFRADRLRAAAQQIVEETNRNGTEFPMSEEQLLEISGIGPYTARSILSHAFGEQVAVLDTNVARIITRFFGVQPQRDRARRDPSMWSAAQDLIPDVESSYWNLALIDFGSTVCIARSPKCLDCPVSRRCSFLKGRKPAQG